MHKLHLYLIIFFLCFQAGHVSFAQVYKPEYAAIVEACSYDTILSNLELFVGSGTKEVGSFALERTKNWLISKHSAYGYTDIVEDVFMYSGMETANIVVTKPGFLYPDTYIIIEGHYDTRNGPGADDNGSGTVALLEIARLLKDIPAAYSIKFIHFSAEEVGLVGSWHYVTDVAIPEELDIKLVFNLDAIGGVNGMANTTITCDRDESSPPSTNNEASAKITSELAACVSLYSSLSTVIANAEASDYMTFEYHDKVITGLYETNINPHYHTPDDVIAHMDVHYLHEVSRAAVGASLHFSGALDSTTWVSKSSYFTKARVYPNPGSGEIFVHLGESKSGIVVQVRNILGQPVFTSRMEAADHLRIHLDKHSAGIYFLELRSPAGESRIFKVILE